MSKKLVTHTFASHKSKPSSVPQGIVDSYFYCTVGHVGGSNSCGGYILLGVATARAG